MTEQHPIIPPPEMVEKWINEWGVPYKPDDLYQHLCTQAARWGADQELEACLEWVGNGRRENLSQVIALRASRRPKPPSLKEQALAELEEIMDELHEATDSAFTASAIILNNGAAIRRALEALDD